MVKQNLNPVVLIHGLFGHLSDQTILSAVGGQNVFAPDLLGYGVHDSVDMNGMTLERQADHVAQYIQDNQLNAVNLVGHSVGGAIAFVVAKRFPELLSSVTSVEGNFTLNDAFWSSEIANKKLSDVEVIIAEYRSDPDGWIANAGVALNDWTKQIARSWLAFQPASTVQEQARAVVTATAESVYLEDVKTLLSSELPVHLIAGERSRSAWDVPGWVSQQVSSEQIIPQTGHLMMAESPALFGRAIQKIAC